MAYAKRGRRAVSTRRGKLTHRSDRARATRVGKVRKAFWLDPRLLDEARTALGAANEREAVELALDLVNFRKELVRGTRALLGLKLSRID